jgi:hypothetical protein
MIEYFCGQKLTEIFYRNIFFEIFIGTDKNLLEIFNLI